jgi:O-antigen/teichoic acid export membrane protein
VRAAKSSDPKDYLEILSGTTQNVAGIVVAGLALIGAQVLMTRVLGAAGYGVVTLLTQATFVASFATRAGMDMAMLRTVAIAVGATSLAGVRAEVARAALIAVIMSAVVALAAVAAPGGVLAAFSLDGGTGLVAAAALGLPFAAVTNVWLGATRGLKIMRYTLYIFWAGQPLAWIAITLVVWTVSKTATAAVLAYSLSWACAAAAAFLAWRKETASWPRGSLPEGFYGRLFRYATPRAPAALLSQLVFWTDLFVLASFATQAEVGVYSAALRAGQIVMLFLTSVNLMFSPYVADLHARGERARLDALFKTLTRWILAATAPAFILLAVAPESMLQLFGGGFAEGERALLILLAGQLVNIATGSAGFVLIMAGRTGWDLVVIAAAVAVDVGLALWLCPAYGMEGAAIANAMAFANANAMRLLLVRRFVAIEPYDRRFARILLPAAACFAVMWAVHAAVAGGWATELAVTGVAGGVTYAVVYLVAGLTPGERRFARSLLGKVGI